MTTRVPADDLYRKCDPALFRFGTTAELPPLEGIMGQERAVSAIDFGLSLRSAGFNIYVLGESGTGKMSAVRSFVCRKAETEPVPPDWCYVYNFRAGDSPIAVSLAPGRGTEFRRDMAELVAHLKNEIPKVFESKDYDRRKSEIVGAFQQKHKELLGSVEEEAAKRGFAIRSNVTGLSLVPLKKEGEPYSEEEFNALDAETSSRIEAAGKALRERLDDVMRTLKEEEKVVKGRIKDLEQLAAISVLGHAVDELREKHAGNDKVTAWLDAVREDVLENLSDFKAQSGEAPPVLPFLRAGAAEPNFTRYAVNVIVDNGGQRGGPCVFESNPSYYNLFGRIEHKFQMGVAATDFTMIKAGSLHRANGGFLVIDALDLLRNLFSYDALKRAIRNREVKIEDIWEQYRAITTAMLKPEPIPLDVKIILLGNPFIYSLLFNLDEEYRDLFKVKADFDNRMERTPDTIAKYASFVASKALEEGLLPFDPSGVASIVEHGSRLAEHQGKLATKFSEISNLVRESHYWARKEGARVVSAWHVGKALDEKLYRHNRIEARQRELIAEGTLIVETSGARAGQVNGLAVIDLGDASFGTPSRITASVYAGEAGVLNIERETKLSGKIHEKAVLILTNYLGRTFAAKEPISLTASIAFEQLYGMIEGDSATCAELYALLSAISGVPIRQDIAVTGSMDQNGAVQPIGGVNEKIEGFFSLCRLRGLDGKQGVIIPRRNVRNLMLRKDVVEAVADGRFTVHAIDRVEEGIAILTGMPAGEPGPDGRYPDGTLHRLVEARLAEIRAAVKDGKAKPKRKKDEGETD